MRSKAAMSLLVHFLLRLGLFFAVTIALCAPPRPIAVTNTAPLVPMTPLATTNSIEEAEFDLPLTCNSTNKLSSYLRRKGIPVDITQVQIQTNGFLFVLAYPYSGISNTDLYCYEKVDKGWMLFLSTVIWGAPPGKVNFMPEGEFMTVLRKGKAILKIRLPDRS